MLYVGAGFAFEESKLDSVLLGTYNTTPEEGRPERIKQWKELYVRWGFPNQKLLAPGHIMQNHITIQGQGGIWDARSCRISGIPSQCGLGLFHNFDGWGDMVYFPPLIRWGEEILRALKYSQVMVTLNDLQFKEQEALPNLGYVTVQTFKNKRTDHQVVIFLKDL